MENWVLISHSTIKKWLFFHKSMLDRSDTQNSWKAIVVNEKMSSWVADFALEKIQWIRRTESKIVGVTSLVIALLRDFLRVWNICRIHKTVLKRSVWTLLSSKILIGMQFSYRDQMKWRSILSIWHGHTRTNEVSWWFKGVETGSLESAWKSRENWITTTIFSFL